MIRVKHRVTGIIDEIPAHYQDFAALFAPWELTDEDPTCVDCAVVVPEPEDDEDLPLIAETPVHEPVFLSYSNTKED